MSRSDDEQGRNSFEDVARALAGEVTRAVERLSEIDVEEIARRANAKAERARRWIDELGRMLRQHPTPAAMRRSALAHHGSLRPGRRTGRHSLLCPLMIRCRTRLHPRDLPTADQGLALAALDSGRWRLEPGTSAVAVHGGGPGASDALGLVRELRVRD